MTSLAHPIDRAAHTFGPADALDLLDWKRRIFALYAEVRTATDPEVAWNHWRDVREDLYRTHPQSPLPPELRGRYRDAFFPYDPAYRVVAEIAELDVDSRRSSVSPIPASTGGTFAFSRLGIAHFALAGSAHELELHWNEAYGGGILLAVADETSGVETYGGGRYVLDTVKGADLGCSGGRIVVDFNFAYNPSCAFDSRWSCPLAPPANRMPLRLAVGERNPG